MDGPAAALNIVRGPEAPPERRRFTHAAFRGSLAAMTFTRQGDLRVTIDVPYSDTHLAVPMSEAYGLTLHVQVDRPQLQ